MLFKSIPKLTEISFVGKYAEKLSNNFMEHSSYLSRLEALSLNVASPMRLSMKSVEYPVLTNLKKLELRIIPTSDENLSQVKRLIRACPFLQKFTLQLEYLSGLRIDTGCRFRKRRPLPHHHLKILEIEGFAGHIVDFEFAIYISNIAVSLEKIILDPLDPAYIGRG